MIKGRLRVAIFFSAETAHLSADLLLMKMPCYGLSYVSKLTGLWLNIYFSEKNHSILRKKITSSKFSKEIISRWLLTKDRFS